MKNTLKIILLCVLVLLLGAELCILCGIVPPEKLLPFTVEETAAPTAAPTQEPTLPPTEPPTEPPTDPPTEPPTEPQPLEVYTFTMVGDCTLGTYKDKWYSSNGFIQTIGENYDYPFDKVRSIFESDDLTLANLEVVLGDKGNSVGKMFTFRGPAAYSNILSGSSVEAVTLANNHSRDYGDAGYNKTREILDEAAIAYVEEYSSIILTLEKGLKVGLYAVNGAVKDIDQSRAVKDIQKLKEDGAEIIIVAAHWGNEGEYRPTQKQETLGKAMIDAGADIIYGHHPHVLQNMEVYNGGIIYYSLGNFCFGGHTNPKDKDSVIVQQQVIRMTDGSVIPGDFSLIPCSISSSESRNTYQPTPCEEGSERYQRVLDKVLGSYEGKNLDIDYSNMAS